jgi:hypothetical protein
LQLLYIYGVDPKFVSEMGKELRKTGGILYAGWLRLWGKHDQTIG